jgi:hypothetical protein
LNEGVFGVAGHDIDALLTICLDSNDFVNIATPTNVTTCGDQPLHIDRSMAVLAVDWSRSCQ